MNTSTIVAADELLTLYQDGKRRGFYSGVIFAVGGYALIRYMKNYERRLATIKNENKNSK